MHWATRGVTLHRLLPLLSLGVHCTVVPEGLGHQPQPMVRDPPLGWSYTSAVVLAQDTQSVAAAQLSLGVGMHSRCGADKRSHARETGRRQHAQNGSLL